MVVVNGSLLLLVFLLRLVVLWEKGSGLPRSFVQAQLLTSFRIQILGTQRRGNGKDCAPFLRRRGRRGGRASQSFSSPWSWVNFAMEKPGTCLRKEQA